MKEVTLEAVVSDGCIGCEICAEICPVEAISMEDRKAIIDVDNCMGCGNCEQRCPVYAIEMVKREEPFVAKVDSTKVDQEKLREICKNAKFNPNQLICYCTGTRAKEVAAAILLGADTPEKISRKTGVRTGCKVECIQPILRLLEGAGIHPTPPEGGHQWYGKTATAWEVSNKVKEKYSKRGFRFEEDRKLLDNVVEQKEGE